jgi:hypothetical protein
MVLLGWCLNNGSNMDRPFVADNAKEREKPKPRSLEERLTEKEPGLYFGNDRTITVSIAHLSFWDQRSLFLPGKWKRKVVTLSPIDIGITQNSFFSLRLAIPPRKAANLKISCAMSIDRELKKAENIAGLAP